MRSLDWKLPLRLFARHFGIEVKASNLYSRDDTRIVRMLEENKIGMVLDVGANRGQFAENLFLSGYAGKIVSFEAIPYVHKELASRALRYGDRWKVAPCCAVGEQGGLANFNILRSDATSSLLEPSGDFSKAGGPLTQEKSIEVEVRRLDELYHHSADDGSLFIKVDVQGAEVQVLKGAKNLIDIAQGVLLEMSLKTIYDNQPLAQEVHDLLTSHGFFVWDCVPVFRDAKSGRLLQYDGVYFRDNTLHQE